MNILESVGKSTIEQVEYVGGLSVQFWHGLRASWRANPVTGNRLRWKATVRQMAIVGVHALPRRLPDRGLHWLDLGASSQAPNCGNSAP